jgi:hypothetical protein
MTDAQALKAREGPKDVCNFSLISAAGQALYIQRRAGIRGHSRRQYTHSTAYTHTHSTSVPLRAESAAATAAAATAAAIHIVSHQVSFVVLQAASPWKNASYTLGSSGSKRRTLMSALL